MKTSAGLVALAPRERCWSVALPAEDKRSFAFRPCRPGRTVGKVTCVTPAHGFYLQMFYDVCPWSPSRRHLAVTRFPFQDREPRPGETADVCIIDLHGRTIETVYRTKGWGFQLGANRHWGTTDRC